MYKNYYVTYNTNTGDQNSVATKRIEFNSIEMVWMVEKMCYQLKHILKFKL